MGLGKSFLLLLIFMVLGGGLLFSETVSVIIVEIGIPEDAPAMESSNVWESGLMDVFFEHGHIVSNASVLRLNTEQANPYPSEQLLNIDEVKEGGSAYYLLAVLDYRNKEKNAIPSLISLRLSQLYPNKVLYEVQADGSQMKALDDELEYAKRTAESLIPYVKKTI